MPQNHFVKITLDGLILISFKTSGAGERCQAGVLVTKFDAGQEHELKIEVKSQGTTKSFSFTHEEVKTKGPLWLYIGAKNGNMPARHTARRHKMSDPSDDASFSHVLDMEGFHGNHQIEVRRGMAMALNIPQGLFCSAKLEKVNYRELGSSGGFQAKDRVATETFTAIERDEVETDEPHLVLWSEEHSHLFTPIKLEAGVPYEVSVKNAPINSHAGHHQSNHFRYYYKAFERLPPKQYEVKIPDPDLGPPSDPDAPPCINGRLRDNSLPDQ